MLGTLTFFWPTTFWHLLTFFAQIWTHEGFPDAIWWRAGRTGSSGGKTTFRLGCNSIRFHYFSIEDGCVRHRSYEHRKQERQRPTLKWFLLKVCAYAHERWSGGWYYIGCLFVLDLSPVTSKFHLNPPLRSQLTAVVSWRWSGLDIEFRAFGYLLTFSGLPVQCRELQPVFIVQGSFYHKNIYYFFIENFTFT